MALVTRTINVNYQTERENLHAFLSKFTERSEDHMDLDFDNLQLGTQQNVPTKYKYLDQLQAIADRKQQSITIELDDLASFEDSEEKTVASISQNAKSYIEVLSTVIDSLMPEPRVQLDYEESVLDVIMSQRRNPDINRPMDGEPKFPPTLTRRYNVYIKPLSTDKAQAVRDIAGASLGHLVTVCGIVTRTSDVKPNLTVYAYSCDSCGSEIFQEVKQRQVNPLIECPSKTCKDNNVKGKLYPQTRASKFLPFQEVKLQEMTHQVPVGHIPRTMTVHLYGALTRSVNPGDICNISGIFLPMPYTGFKALRAGLLTDTYLEVQHVEKLKKQYNQMQSTPAIRQKIELMSQDPDIYSKLAKSIAPEIHGHEDVKKALLLLLVGGVTKSVGDGLKIRGDINICLMGDPGVAKSQLLKYISKVAPRGVYTTGRGSSGVGLTAAVMRDPVTDEMVLEGGALVLSDNGICCIDEFDKMDDSDRTAIHEVMEQQTISISKAGITTTLNARTSILAAANPLYGRYNPRLSLEANVNLPAALLSRFDILYLMRDRASLENDRLLAEHVTYVHTHSKQPDVLGFEPSDPETIRHYVAQARQTRPVLTPEVGEYLEGAYVQLRKQQNDYEKNNKENNFSYATPRSLLGLIRMSQALARLRFLNVVDTADVDEALRLLDVSKSSLYDDEPRNITNPSTGILEIIRKMAESLDDSRILVKRQRFNDVRNRVLASGYTLKQLDDCIREYEDMNIWYLSANRNELIFVGGGESDDEE